jgi:hypothetical protein
VGGEMLNLKGQKTHVLVLIHLHWMNKFKSLQWSYMKPFAKFDGLQPKVCKKQTQSKILQMEINAQNVKI